MISPNIITQIAKRDGVNWGVVEKDYFLTLLLEGVSVNDFLKENLVFKGGTALRKIYFKHYRYSEDLDFTLRNQIKEEDLIVALESIFTYLKKEHNAAFYVKSIYNTDWFVDLKIQFTGLKEIKNTVTCDLMSDEMLIDDLVKGKIFNPYYNKDLVINTYSLKRFLEKNSEVCCKEPELETTMMSGTFLNTKKIK
jgi:predicted nucleotidyltransferase component of viral defense system